MEQFPLPAKPASPHMPQNAQFSWSFDAFYTIFNALTIFFPTLSAASIETITDSVNLFPSVAQFNSELDGLTGACDCIQDHLDLNELLLFLFFLLFIPLPLLSLHKLVFLLMCC